MIEMTKEQHAARAHNLEAVGKAFRPVREVEFKHGEIVGLDVQPEELPRYLTELIKPVDGKAGKAKSQPKPKAAEKGGEGAGSGAGDGGGED